jgi:enoyl-CoA hydratase/carnithine racemase
MASLVKTTTTDGIVEVRLNRPEKLNAVNAELQEALYEALKRVNQQEAGPLLLTGNGRATCAGADVDRVSADDFLEDQTAGERYRHDQIPKLIEEYPLPTAMAAKGAVAGTGFSLSLSCDFVVIGEETHYAYPEVEHGIAGPPEKIERVVGPRLAKEIMMTGAPIAPERAREMGLVTRVVPEESVEAETRAFLSDLMEHDVETLRETKSKIDSLWVRRQMGVDTPTD